MELTDINIPSTLASSSDQVEAKEQTSVHLDSVRELFGEANVTYYPGAYLIPQLGKLKWDGHIYVSGATGAGKSYLIRQIVENDLKTRKVYLFSDVKNDASLKGLTLHPGDGIVDLGEHLRDCICIFDDYNQGRDLRDAILEKGRHFNCMCICVNHKHREWKNTMKPLNESKYVVLFPSANKGVV